ncbi:hypothetical protein HDV00_006669 [Rhizophlyctis rosea]|nr:hypothetical protein HDV00_006669 [Rhizophlyctis rosea]
MSGYIIVGEEPLKEEVQEVIASFETTILIKGCDRQKTPTNRDIMNKKEHHRQADSTLVFEKELSISSMSQHSNTKNRSRIDDGGPPSGRSSVNPAASAESLNSNKHPRRPAPSSHSAASSTPSDLHAWCRMSLQPMEVSPSHGPEAVKTFIDTLLSLSPSNSSAIEECCIQTLAGVSGIDAQIFANEFFSRRGATRGAARTDTVGSVAKAAGAAPSTFVAGKKMIASIKTPKKKKPFTLPARYQHRASSPTTVASSSSNNDGMPSSPLVPTPSTQPTSISTAVPIPSVAPMVVGGGKWETVVETKVRLISEFGATIGYGTLQLNENKSNNDLRIIVMENALTNKVLLDSPAYSDKKVAWWRKSRRVIFMADNSDNQVRPFIVDADTPADAKHLATAITNPSMASNVPTGGVPTGHQHVRDNQQADDSDADEKSFSHGSLEVNTGDE